MSGHTVRSRDDRVDRHTMGASGPVAARSEDVHVRNYDSGRAYTLGLRILNDDGTVAFEHRYRLEPGQFTSERDVLEPGDYGVELTVDGGMRKAVGCRVDEDPEHSILIEVGNGAASVTEGVF